MSKIRCHFDWFMTSLENEPQLAIQFNPDMDKDAKN